MRGRASATKTETGGRRAGARLGRDGGVGYEGGGRSRGAGGAGCAAAAGAGARAAGA